MNPLNTGNSTVAYLLTKQVSAGSTPTYTARFLQNTYYPVPGMPAVLSSLTLTIIDALTGLVINDCENVNILNTGRGSVDQNGVLSITLEAGDTNMDDVPGETQVERSLIISYSTGGGLVTNTHTVEIMVINPYGPLSSIAIPPTPSPDYLPSYIPLGTMTAYVLPNGTYADQRVLIVDNLQLASQANPIVIHGNFNNSSGTVVFIQPGQAIEPLWDIVNQVWVLA